MSQELFLDRVRKAATDYQLSEHQLRLSVTAARAADVPIASIARAAGVTRQTVYNWSVSYGCATKLTVSASTTLTDLPTQRPKAVKGAPVLILSSRIRKGLKQWDGRLGQASGYAGDELAVRVPDKIVDVIAGSWALIGDSSGAGQRPDAGDFVICDDGTLGIVKGNPATWGDIKVEQDGSVSRRAWWAIVLPGISRR